MLLGEKVDLKKLLVWGTGEACKEFLDIFKERYSEYYFIIGFIDSSVKKQGAMMCGKKVYLPENITNLEWDRILICTYRSDYQTEIIEYMKQVKIDMNRVSLYSNYQGMDLLKPFIVDKYKDTSDKEIKDILEYLKNNELSVFNQYIKKKGEKYEVHQEQDDDPYIIIGNKRMYYPKEILKIENTPYLMDVFSEQEESSPHLYVRSKDEISQNSIIVDAGTQEGNFSINYVDKAKKIYLIECEKIWCRVLEKTFAPYRHKVVICNKFLSKEDNLDCITLDSLIKEDVDFVKMDVEGSEIEGILGGKRILTQSNAKLAICSYHHSNDEKYIRFMLDAYGYKTEVSNGYMAFIWDKYFCNSLDFRRGIVYGKK